MYIETYVIYKFKTYMMYELFNMVLCIFYSIYAYTILYIYSIAYYIV